MMKNPKRPKTKKLKPKQVKVPRIDFLQASNDQLFGLYSKMRVKPNRVKASKFDEYLLIKTDAFLKVTIVEDMVTLKYWRVGFTKSQSQRKRADEFGGKLSSLIRSDVAICNERLQVTLPGKDTKAVTTKIAVVDAIDLKLIDKAASRNFRAATENSKRNQGASFVRNSEIKNTAHSTDLD